MPLSHRDLFKQHVAQTSTAPLGLEIERAEGVYMYDTEGNKILDLISGIGVSNVGHRHPKVLEAIKGQMDKYLHLMVYGEFIQSPQTLLAQALSETTSGTLNNAYFVNSGSEAVEGALKLAKRYTGRKEIVHFDKSYHGSTHGALSIAGDESLKGNYRPLLPFTRQLRYNNLSDIKEISTKTAAVIVECVQGEAGIRAGEPEFIKALEERCRETGALFIADEIQTGYGRTGKFWAYQHYGVQPDILTCAKGMGGGMPVGAFLADKKIMQCLTENPVLGHITTFGGHPLSCAAALATLEVIRNDNLMNDISKKEQILKARLNHPKIKALRSKGLMMAVEFESFDYLRPLIDRIVNAGVLTDWFLFNDKSMRIAPPLIITEDELEKACNLILSHIH